MSFLENLTLFNAVVEKGSFTAAAQALGLSKSWVSKTISSMESELGVQLLQRTTRSLALTEEGELLLQYGKKAAKLENDALEALNFKRNRVQGKLRVTAPVTFGQAWLADLVVNFHRVFPQVNVDLHMSNDKIDLVAAGFDLAFRITWQLPLNYKALRLAEMEQVLVAAPSYINEHGEPDTPDDLVNHTCLIYQNPQPESTWTFEGANAPIEIKVTGKLGFNYHHPMVDAVKSGIGIARLPNYAVQQSLKSGELIHILKPYRHRPTPIYLIYPLQENLPQRTRAFIDFAKTHLHLA